MIGDADSGRGSCASGGRGRVGCGNPVVLRGASYDCDSCGCRDNCGLSTGTGESSGLVASCMVGRDGIDVGLARFAELVA